MGAVSYEVEQEVAQREAAAKRPGADLSHTRMVVPVVLACLFGPVGLLYAAPRAAAALGAVGVGAAFVARLSPMPGLAVLVMVWLLCIEWAAAAASSLPVLWYLRPTRSTAGEPSEDLGARRTFLVLPTTSATARRRLIPQWM